MSEVLQIFMNRKSQRNFIDKPILPELLEKIIDCGRLAATARNIQPWEFIVVTDKETREHIAEVAETGRFIAQASACVAVFCQDTKYYLEDGCAATENILLAATALGIDSCWVAGDKKPYAEKIGQMLSIPEGYKLISLIALGYSPQNTPPQSKRPLKEVLHWERF